MSLISRLKSGFKGLSKPAKSIIMISLVLVISAGAIWGAKRINQNRYYENLKKELAAEESNESEFPAKEPTDADDYVNDFTYAVDIKVGESGFEPSSVSVKPQTKLVFNGSDDNPHFIAVSPGGLSPKFFDPQLDVTKNSVFQTKVEEEGVYSFYDTRNPTSTLVVHVKN